MSNLFCSQRLTVRPLQEGDLSWFADMQADSQVMNLSAQPVQTRGQSGALLAKVKGQADLTCGQCLWAIENEAQVGVGVVAVCLDRQRRWRIGYQFKGRFWRRGYATELLPELLIYLAHHLPQQPLYAEVLAQNYASCRVLEKSGFRLLQERQDQHTQALTRYYCWQHQPSVDEGSRALGSKG